MLCTCRPSSTFHMLTWKVLNSPKQRFEYDLAQPSTQCWRRVRSRKRLLEDFFGTPTAVHIIHTSSLKIWRCRRCPSWHVELVTLSTLRVCRWNPPRFEAISWSYSRSRCDCWPEGSITTPVAAAGDAFDGVTSTASTTRPSHLGCTFGVVALNGGS